MRILIADDSGVARMFTKRCLEIAGFQGSEFVEVPNGQAAWETARTKPFDLIVTDIVMPLLQGTELLKLLKSNPSTKQIPVIIVTSAKNPAKEKELLDQGACAVLGKPVSPALFNQSLQKLFPDKMRTS